MNQAQSSLILALRVSATAKGSKKVDKDVLLSPSQAIRLMTLCIMIRDGDLAFRGYEEEDEQNAASVLQDVGEEIALQLGGAG